MTDNQHKLLFHIIDGSYKVASVGGNFSIQKVKGIYPITGFVQNITKSNSIIVYKRRQGQEEFETESVWFTPNHRITINVC